MTHTILTYGSSINGDDFKLTTGLFLFKFMFKYGKLNNYYCVTSKSFCNLYKEREQRFSNYKIILVVRL